MAQYHVACWGETGTVRVKLRWKENTGEIQVQSRHRVAQDTVSDL